MNGFTRDAAHRFLYIILCVVGVGGFFASVQAHPSQRPEAGTAFAIRPEAIGSAYETLESATASTPQIASAITDLNDQELHQLLSKWRSETSKPIDESGGHEELNIPIGELSVQETKDRKSLIEAELLKRLREDRESIGHGIRMPEGLPQEQDALIEVRRNLIVAEKEYLNGLGELTETDYKLARKQWREQNEEALKQIRRFQIQASERPVSLKANELTVEEQAYRLRRQAFIEHVKGLEGDDAREDAVDEFEAAEAQQPTTGEAK